MTNHNYQVFGIGVGSSDLRYIGWTEKSLNEVQDQLIADLMKRTDGLPTWVEALRGGAKPDIFEIESVSTAEDARGSAFFWRRYFRSLGLDLPSDGLDS